MGYQQVRVPDPVRFPVASMFPVEVVAIPFDDEAGAIRDRRHGGRVASSGTAVVHGRRIATHARVVDLAAGGVRVVLDSIAAASLGAGTHVQLDLRVDGIGRWLHVIGRVGRVEPHAGSTELVIELQYVPPEFEDLVQNELLAALECVHTRHLLLVDAAPGRRALVATAFRATGCCVIEASSSLEAIAKLDESQLHPWAVVIADTDLHPRADGLRAFLAEVYPRVPLIVIGERGRAALSVDLIPDLAVQVTKLLARNHGLGMGPGGRGA